MFKAYNHNLTTIFKAKIQFYDNEGKEDGSPREVQINPSEISISRGCNYKSKKGVGDASKEKSYQTEEGGLGEQSISMTLHFDLVEAYDSIMNSVNKALGTIPSVFSSSFSGSDENDDFVDTVKKRILNPKGVDELSLLEDKFTCLPRLEVAAMRGQTIFITWGSQAYIGRINSFNLTYTYFSERGEPLRANVQLSLHLDGNSETSKNSSSGSAEAYVVTPG